MKKNNYFHHRDAEDTEMFKPRETPMTQHMILAKDASWSAAGAADTSLGRSPRKDRKINKRAESLADRYS